MPRASRELTAAVAVPTIGIGGSPACAWQILVIDDMFGLFTEFTPKSVKRYRRLGDEIRAAAREYAEECDRAASRPPSTLIRRSISLDFSQSEIQANGGSLERVGEADRRDGASANGSTGAR